MDHLKSPVFLSTAGVLESQDALASWVLAAHLRPDFSMENLLIKQGTVLGSYFLYRFPSFSLVEELFQASNFHFSLRFRHVELCSWRDFGSFLEKMTWWHCCSANWRRRTKRKQQDVEILDFQNQAGNIWELWLQGLLHVAWFVYGDCGTSYGVKAVWDVIVWFLFDSRRLVSDSRRSVSESSLLAFRSLFGFPAQKSCCASVCKVYSCFAPAFSEGMILCRPPRSSVSWIFDAEHADIPGHI